jgi:hypothetical protein
MNRLNSTTDTRVSIRLAWTAAAIPPAVAP